MTLEVGVASSSLLIPTTLASRRHTRKVLEGVAPVVDFWQGLPFRSSLLRALPCRYIERPRPGLKSGPNGWEFASRTTVFDRTVFEKANECHRWREEKLSAGAQEVVRSMQEYLPSTLLETSPEVGIDIGTGQLLNFAQSQGGPCLVYDTNHVRNDLWLDFTRTKFLKSIAPFVALIHFQPLRDPGRLEWQNFCKKRTTELEQIVHVLLDHGAQPQLLLEVSWLHIQPTTWFLTASPGTVAREITTAIQVMHDTFS